MRRHGAIHVPAPPEVPKLSQVAAVHALTVPMSGSWFRKCPPDRKLLLNDVLGCCVSVADWRWIETMRAEQGFDLTIDPEWVRARYEMTGDYVDGNPATDQGTDTARDMLNWVAGPILIPSDGTLETIAWASVPPANDAEISIALWNTPLLVTLQLPRSRADDLAAWALPPDHEPGTLGHRVLAGAWDGRERVVRSWGEDAPIHPEFWTRYVVAVDAPIPVTSLSSLQFAGMDYEKLAAAMDSLRA